MGAFGVVDLTVGRVVFGLLVVVRVLRFGVEVC